jgi:ribosomal protein S18 acetylase RimI-like enzyme
MPPGGKACFDRLTQSRYVSADFSIFSMEGETVMDSVEIVEADLDLGAHQKAVLDLVDAYARDPMGNGGPLPDHVKDELIPGLKKHPTTLILIAFVNREAVGIAVCFVGFSTFAARPLINVHDLAVLPGQRGVGVGRQLLAAVEEKARTMGCCKVTLEVLENNRRALKVYQAAGFARATYTEEAGGALFYAKNL